MVHFTVHSGQLSERDIYVIGEVKSLPGSCKPEFCRMPVGNRTVLSPPSGNISEKYNQSCWRPRYSIST